MSYTFQERIIPTYVGSTSGASVRNLNKPNHSHVCGINNSRGCWVLTVSESFPRMWDQPPQCVVRNCALRIIPTYVGSTISSCTEGMRTTNHSHVCGINDSQIANPSCFLESFPRMWDQLCKIQLFSRFARIIPTYVGSTKF